MKRLLALLADHASRVVNHAWRVARLIALALAFASGPGRSVAADWYVATNGTGYGTSWADATNSLQGAINNAVASETVWVSNGVYDTELTVTPGYALTNRVVITNAITVRSANNDPTNTIIKGAGPRGDNAVRCVYMTNSASLIGFTLTNGYTMTSGNAINDQSGGGVLLHVNSFVSNCIFSYNTASNGGGAYLYNGGTLNNCTLISNTAVNYGGGAYLTNGGTLGNCTLTGNSGWNHGGGAYLIRGGTLNNCTLSGNNTISYGGGVSLNYGGTLNNCTLSRNSAVSYGGGAYTGGGGAMYNCTLLENYGGNGGAVRLNNGGSMYNCTISRNKAASAGGGVYNSSGGTLLENCIVWGNTGGTSSNISIAGTVTLSNSCSGSDPVPSGSGNIGADPQFVNTNAGNYRLTASSPCVNTGTNGSWTTSYPYDLDGRARIRYGKVDMGAYERIHNGTICGVH